MQIAAVIKPEERACDKMNQVLPSQKVKISGCFSALMPVISGKRSDSFVRLPALGQVTSSGFVEGGTKGYHSPRRLERRLDAG
jgi:hypothetical protein